MISADHFEALEDRRLRLRANLRAGFHAVKTTVKDSPEYEALTGSYEGFSDAVRVANRALALADRNVDPRFENPADIAFLAYLLFLEAKAPELSRYVADRLLETPNLAWAGRKANEVVRKNPWRNEGANSVSLETGKAMTDQPFNEIGQQRVAAALGHRRLAAASAEGGTRNPTGPARERRTVNRLLRETPAVSTDTGPSSGSFEDRELR